MECPKCHVKMARGFCIRCGYIDEETKMKDHQIHFEKSDLERYLKSFYTTVLYNQNRKIIFVLGPLYFAYLDYFWLSLFLGLVDFCFIVCVGYLFQSAFAFLLAVIIDRLLYMMFANSLYIFMVNKKIKRWKKKYQDDFIKKLQNKKSKNFFLPLLVVLIYIVMYIVYTHKH